MTTPWPTVRCRQCDDAGKAATQPFCDHDESYVVRPDVDSDIAAAWSRVSRRCVPLDGHWVWTGYVTEYGYGQTKIKGRSAYVHRVSYEFFVGPITPGLQVDHICRNKLCVHPAHLRPADHKQNAENLDGAKSRSKTGIRGVYRIHNGTYAVQVTHHRQRYSGGCYVSLKDAARAAAELRNQLFSHNQVDREALAVAIREDPLMPCCDLHDVTTPCGAEDFCCRSCPDLRGDA